MAESFKFYEVGGKIRDEFLGLTNKDVDYVAVPNTKDSVLLSCYTAIDMFGKLEYFLREKGFEIFLITPDCYTIRAKFPEGYKYQGVADFVMARKEIGYILGTRIPIVEPGNLFDDLSRRDFTVNAMAKDPDTGEIIDYFNGRYHIGSKKLITPLDPIITFDDDPLRILRGIRFCITKGFTFGESEFDAIWHYDYNSKMSVVSTDRIREELLKCFKYDTLETINTLRRFPCLQDYIFTRTNIWLKPTTEC